MVYFYPDFFIDLDGCMDAVEASLRAFDQPHADGSGLFEEKETCARFRGQMAGWKYAEAYKILKFPNAPSGPELILPKLLGDNFRWAGKGFYPWGSQYFV
jgi:hypothetical protein